LEEALEQNVTPFANEANLCKQGEFDPSPSSSNKLSV
jgi:hypothetical protein